ncbi:MAG: ABC transporter permease [Clostridia bacterium]
MVNAKKLVGKAFIWLVLLFLYLPILWMIVFSFSETPSFSNWAGFSFNNYINLFTGDMSGEIFEALANTMIIAIYASVLSTVLGTFAAIGLNSIKKKRIKNIYKNVNQIPMVNSEIVTAVSLMLLFGLLYNIFPLHGDVQLFNVIIAHTTFCTPYVVLNVLPRLQQTDNKLYEAALDLGCTPSQAIWKVVIPDILPGIIMGMLMAFTLSIDDFVITQFTVNGFKTLSTLIYAKAQGKKSLPPEMRALSSIIFIVIFGLLIFMNRPKNKAKAQGQPAGAKK